MKVLGIDPGYERLGIAILEKNKGDQKESLVYSDCFKTSSKIPHHQRLSLIFEELNRLIKEFKPDALSIETLFFNTNQKTVMNVSESRGVIVALCSFNKMDIKEFSPLQIKSAVTGNGRSDKNGVIKMIPLLIKLDKKIKHDDEYDAIAAGLTYFANSRNII